MLSRFILFTLFFFSVSSAFAQNPVWISTIADESVFLQYSIADHSRPDLRRVGKYILPAKAEATFQSLAIHDVNRYPLHFDFLIHELPDFFGGWSMNDYLQDVLEPNRQYYAGALFQFQSKSGQTVYGFNIATLAGNPITLPQASEVYRVLEKAIALQPFAYAPMTQAEQAAARQWSNPGFPLYLPEGLTLPAYEAYSPAINYGRVRLFTLQELADAMTAGEIGWQDLIVVDEAPTDIETVVAGVVTGTPQGELSHLNVRMLRRGTPNVFINQAREQFTPYVGQLVRFKVTEEGYEVETGVSIEEAEAFWQAHRPKLEPLPVPDESYHALEPLQSLAEQPKEAWVTRVGGKAAGLAQLYAFLDPAYQVQGFAIPFSYYTQFMKDNVIPDYKNPTQWVSYETYIQHLFADEAFRSDSRVRVQALTQFQEYMEDYGTIPPSVLDSIRHTILTVFQSEFARVRFRSSSNAEDDLLFTGAGLYDSTTVCMQDELDGDESGPSKCDSSKKKERTIERGLKRVWASLWNPRAVEERAYYQIDPSAVRMGILVTQSFPDEDSNGVVFSGDLAAGTKDYLVVNVQLGDESVVQPGTGIVPEKNAIYPNLDGSMEIRRLRGSSLMPPGEWILSEAQLIELGTVVQHIDATMPLPSPNVSREDVVMDMEFKFDEGQLFIKQIRPTLFADRLIPQPEQPITLHIPSGTQMGNTFQDFVPVEDIYAGKSLITFIEGDHLLPIQPGTYTLNLIQRFEFGPQRELLPPADAGRLTVEKIEGYYTYYLFTYTQSFSFGEEEIALTFSDLKVFVTDGRLETHTLVFDPDTVMYLDLWGRRGEQSVRYASATHDTLPLFLSDIVLEDGHRLRLYQRWRAIRHGSTPARLVYADILLEGQSLTQDRFWNLEYSCKRHNSDEEYLVLFDTPLQGAVGIVVKTLYQDGLGLQVYTVDANLQPLRYYTVSTYTKEETTEVIPPIRTPVKEWILY